MDIRRLEIHQSELGDGVRRLRRSVQGAPNLDYAKVGLTIAAIESLLKSEGFDHLVSKVLRPFQCLVAVASKIKQDEGAEVAGLTKDPELLGVVESNEVAETFFNKHNDEYLKKRWGVGLRDGNIDKLWEMRTELDQQLTAALGAMASNVARLESKQEILGPMEVEGWPALYNSLLTLFSQLGEALMELQAHLTQIKYALSVLYAPLQVGHQINDRVLMKMHKLVQNIKLLIEKMRKEHLFNSFLALEQVLDEAKVCPTYNMEMELGLPYSKFPAFSAERLKMDVEIRKLRLLVEFTMEERERLAKNPGSFKTLVKRDLDKTSIEKKLVRDKLGDQGIPMDAEIDDSKEVGVIMVRSFEDAVSKVSVRVSRRLEMLDLIDQLLEEDSVEEAELVQRIYMFTYNLYDWDDDENQDQYFEIWKKGRRDLAALIASKKRAEVGLKVADLPTATTSATKTAAAEASTTAKPTKPAGR